MTEGYGIPPRKSTRRQVAGLLFAATVAVISFVTTVDRPALAAMPVQMTYQVTHSRYGSIGTYVNTVQPTNGGTTVLTRAHFEVKMLGLKLYSENADRTERWQGNRLISFHSVTSKGDASTEVKGEAHGNSFVITSPAGTVTAPATVHPANPWSPNFLSSNAMMRPDTGRVERVHVSGGEEATVTIDGVPVRAQKYDVDGDARYTVWLNGQGVPVMFIADDDSGKVTFTLAHCSGCGPAGAQLGMR
jgi:Family of unknown function (DUF6134)